MTTLNFGKFADYEITAIPNGYLDWLLGQEFFLEKYSHLIEEIEEELETRKRSHIYLD